MVLGVDGGNTKTDYFLFTNDGKLVSHIRAGTCSHERLADSFNGSFRVIREHIDRLLKQSSVDYSEVEVGVFGLAGVDTKSQREALQEKLSRLNINKIIVDNDGFLGIKAASDDGTGVCSINGTGTVTVGIDSQGNRLQVGGIGDIVGDDAGGAFITRLAIRCAYSSVFRCGQKTEFTQRVLKLLQCSDEKLELLDAISDLYKRPIVHLPFIQLMFEYAEAGDAAAVKAIDHIAYELACSVAGCIGKLKFEDRAKVILAGSVWVRPKSDVLRDTFKRYVTKLTNIKIEYITLVVPPGIGAILWALEEQCGKSLNKHIRDNIIREMERIYGN
ncbi:N-acetylglucosamine kinase [Candidatus Epulonipiscium viviparus]|uniref:N-acetylglucosamine kinase n=1 Tax=Candidatus Epulonipiscium viviparus TaxID=420336 RepID=UPI00016C0C34|nr:BadF/BadG/BcrA/BcrD ATPase family protein [Candidatus Epulopiscium viviparus]